MPSEMGIGALAVWLASVAVIVLIPVAVLACALRLGQRRASARPAEVLRSRLARGEITPDDFDTAMRALGR